MSASRNSVPWSDAVEDPWFTHCLLEVFWVCCWKQHHVSYHIYIIFLSLSFQAFWPHLHSVKQGPPDPLATHNGNTFWHKITLFIPLLFGLLQSSNWCGWNIFIVPSHCHNYSSKQASFTQKTLTPTNSWLLSSEGKVKIIQMTLL